MTARFLIRLNLSLMIVCIFFWNQVGRRIFNAECIVLISTRFFMGYGTFICCFQNKKFVSLVVRENGL